MILAALFLVAQDVPAPAPEPEGEDIVVQAKLGNTTMLFDKGSDGRLRNCRIMVSSGSGRRDANACQATPVCYSKTRDTVPECVDLAFVETRTAAPAPVGTGKPQVFNMPQLLKSLPPVTPPAIGPNEHAESPDTERQRVKLPPLPTAPRSEPVVKFTTGERNDPPDRATSLLGGGQ
ncbi:hypothetical protein AB2M62_14575 [Sphingomonas sp. MMS12-HWE2-04]|uniref:hypothetical protein n=1 Tax=Sphingomonas sp. MMS12-HWE2-04 TaxID=3234199 RepID=UPI00385027AD